MKWLQTSSGTPNGNVTVIKHATQYRLININAFNFIHIHFYGVAPD